MARPLPFVAGHPLLGSARELARAPHDFLARIAAANHGIAGFRVFRRKMVSLADAELAHEVPTARWKQYARGRQSRNLGVLGNGLLSLDGEAWLERRRLAQTAFHRKTLSRVVEVTQECVRAMLAPWERGGVVALQTETLRLSMNVIARMLLSAEISPATADQLGQCLRDGLSLVVKRNTGLWAPPLWLATPTNRGLRAVRRKLNDFIVGEIAAHESRAASDLFFEMRAARNPRDGGALSAEALLEETKTLFFAGYETSATALTWALYLLGRNPAAQQAMFEELDRVLGPRDPQAGDLPNLPYARAVILETMRLYPPVNALARRALADDELGGYRITRETPVMISIQGLHRAPVWGNDAEGFRPERFLSPDWPRRWYMPFGAGRHICIGSDFALHEPMVALAMIVRRYRFETLSCVGVKARITLTPDREIQMDFERRREPTPSWL